MADGNPEPPAEASTRTALSGQTAPSSAGGGAAAGGGQDASVAFVTQTYTNYVQDLQKTFDGLRQRAATLQQDAPAQLQELQSKIQPQTQELVSTIQDTEAPIAVATPHVVEVFAWSSLLLFSFSVSSLFGAYLFSPIFGIFIGRAGAALIASIGIPLGLAYYLNEADGSSSETRQQLLISSGVQGVLLGHALSATYASQPLAFVTPLVIAFAYPLTAAQVGQAHVPLIAGALGASFAVQLVLGILGGSLSGSYLLLALFYTAAAGVTLQLANKYLQAPNRLHLYQILLTGSIIFSKALVFGLLGGDGQIDKK